MNDKAEKEVDLGIDPSLSKLSKGAFQPFGKYLLVFPSALFLDQMIGKRRCFLSLIT